MSRSLALLSAAALLPLSSFAADATWTGTAGDDDFSNAANWGGTAPSGNTLTVNSDNAVIDLTEDVSPAHLYVRNGEINQSAGTLTVGNFRVGSGAANGSPGVAEYNMTGGTIVAGAFRIALYGGTGTMNLSNNAAVTASGNLYVGAGGDSLNSASVGVLLLEDNSSFTVTNASDTAVSIGNFTAAGTGTLEVKGHAAFATNGEITLGTSSTATGTIKLSGNGTIAAKKFWRGTGSAIFTADGGTLKAIANQNNFLENLTVTLLAGGVTIDTQSHAVSNITDEGKTSLFTGVGGLTKAGTGTLTINRDHDYTGVTKVDEGTLVIAGSIDSAAIEVASGATLTLQSADAVEANIVTLTLVTGSTLNLDFTGELFVNGIKLDGVYVDANTYSAADWGALNGIVSGTGTITVVPEPSTYALLGAAGLVGLVALRRRRK